MARVLLLRQRVYGIAVSVWSLAFAIVAGGMCCLLAVLVQRWFLRAEQPLMEVLLIPRMVAAVAYKVVVVGTWPVLLASVVLWGLRPWVPPIDLDEEARHNE